MSTATVGRQYAVDLSSNNGPVNLDKLWSEGFRILILKVTESAGAGAYAWAESHALSAAWHRKGGIVWHYHFLRPGPSSSNIDGQQQARFFWAHVRADLGVGDRFVIDVEAEGVDVAEVHAFIEYLHQVAPHVTGLVYGPPYFLRDHHITPVHAWGLWLAVYASNIPFVPPGWGTWTAWQFTQTGTVPGVAGEVDVSRLRRSTLEPTLRYRERCFAVRDLKHALRSAGYRGFTSSDRYGFGCRRAVAKYKQAHGRKPIGQIAGAWMWRSLRAHH